MRKMVVLLLLMSLPRMASTQKHCEMGETGNCCKCPAQYEMSDKAKLTHLKGDFYRNSNEHLYHLTQTGRPESYGNKGYFNGTCSQEIDVPTFSKIKGEFFAKDKNSVYTFRPRSGGIQITKINGADPKTFQPLGMDLSRDKNHFYDFSRRIDGFSPSQTKIVKDKDGFVVKLVQGDKVYSL